jgi:peroxiredoxin
MPTMEKAYRKYRDKGFEVVAVSVDAGPKSSIKSFLRELGLSFQVLLDPDMETLRAFRGFSLPMTVVIDRQGVIRSRELGYRDWSDGESTKLLQRLLSEKSS